jgi:benzoate membrane transport protein
MSLLKDFSTPAVVAGFVMVLVGFTSSAALVFQAALAFGATPVQVGSWILALGFGMGATCILLSLRYRVPLVTAWSTPGAAMLITAAAGVSINEAIGAFLVCGFLIALAGYSGLFEPFGAFALNLAAITAAICMGREAHEGQARRYVAAIAAGVFYLVLGLFGAAVGALFAAFPRALVLAIAGLALFGTIGGALAQALSDESEREPALITLLVTASGLTLGGVGSAFWGPVAGAVARLVLRRRRT